MICIDTLLHYIDYKIVLIFSWALNIFEKRVTFQVTLHFFIFSLVTKHVVRFQLLPFILLWSFHMMATRSSPSTCLIFCFLWLGCFSTLRFENLLTCCMLLECFFMNVGTLSSFLDSFIVYWNFICYRIFFFVVKTWLFLKTSDYLLFRKSPFLFIA